MKNKTNIMKQLLFVLAVFLITSSTVIAQTTDSKPTKEVRKTTYSCPMHPKEVSDSKGKCSKCGMDLVLVKKKKAKQSNYICTMDGATSDKAGNCPKCGMAMTESKSDKK
jgi:transcription initiation factor IIE alpha subunit